MSTIPGAEEERIYKNRTLKNTIGCSNCKIRKECDDLCCRQDIKGPIILGFGVRSSHACIRLHSAHSQNDLIYVT